MEASARMSMVSEQEKCEGCPVRKLFPDTVFVPPLLVLGNRLAVAECPGSTEVEQLTPLVGASGSWLRGRVDEHGKRSGGLYRAAGVDQSTVSLCNILNCGIAADHKNTFPTDPDARSYISKEDAEGAVRHCLKNHVYPILADSRWTRLDILGSKSLQALTGLKDGIQIWRGSPTVVPATGKTTPIAIPTLHPAFLARSQELMPAVVADLKKTTDVPDEHYNATPSLEDVRNFTATEFAFDIECIRETGEITMVGLYAQSTRAICVPAKGVYLGELVRIFSR